LTNFTTEVCRPGLHVTYSTPDLHVISNRPRLKEQDHTRSAIFAQVCIISKVHVADIILLLYSCW